MSINWDNVEFKNEKRFLSNMYPTEIKFGATNEKWKARFPNVDFDGEIYGSSEHIYMAMKSKNPLWKKMIREIYEPRKTKKLNQQCIKTDILFDTETQFRLRDDWDDIKYEVMTAIVNLKFFQNKELANKLINLEGDIEERNDWGDIYWGTVNGEGENNLGKILMEVREILKRIK